MKTAIRGGLAAAVIALGLCAAATASAQTATQTTKVSNFEIVSVDGNHLVVRDQLGTRELTVPADFRFTVDGRSLAVSDLTAGMKGTATVTTTTTTRPVYVTEVKKGLILRRTGLSVDVRDEGGKTHRFTQAEVDARGIQIFLDGKPTRVASLVPGQRLTATIVTSAPPEVLTEQQVDATLAPTVAPAAEEPVAAAVEVPAETAPAPAAEAPVEAAPEVVAEEPAVEATPAPVEESSRTWLWLLLLLVAVLVIWLVARNRKKEKN